MVDLFADLDAIDASFPDTDKLLSKAHDKIAEQSRAVETIGVGPKAFTESKASLWHTTRGWLAGLRRSPVRDAENGALAEAVLQEETVVMPDVNPEEKKRPRLRVTLTVVISICLLLIAAGLGGAYIFAYLPGIRTTQTAIMAALVHQDTATAVPTQTTQPSRTATLSPKPTATMDADPSVYDNFANPDFDGRINEGRWNCASPSCVGFVQRDGKLVFSSPKILNHSLVANAVLNHLEKQHISLTNPLFYETQLEMSANSNTGVLGFYIENGKDWQARCDLMFLIVDQPQAYCRYIDRQRIQEDFGKEQAVLGQVYLMRIEIDSKLRKISFHINGKWIGSHWLGNDEPLDESLAYGIFGASNNRGINKSFAGYIDNVRIGEVLK